LSEILFQINNIANDAIITECSNQLVGGVLIVKSHDTKRKKMRNNYNAGL